MIIERLEKLESMVNALSNPTPQMLASHMSRYLGDKQEGEITKVLTVVLSDYLKKWIADYYDTTIHELVNGTSHRKQMVEARALYFYMMREHTLLTHRDIGNLLNSPHNSCSLGVKRINDLIVTDPDVRHAVRTLNEQIAQIKKNHYGN